MGARTDHKLREIEEIRDRLEHKMAVLEHRFPVAGWGRRGAALLASTGLLTTIAAFFTRRRSDGGRKKKKEKAETTAAPVVVNVFPRSATVVAAVGIAVWAGVRLFEAYSRSHPAEEGESFRPSVVPMPGTRAAGDPGE